MRQKVAHEVSSASRDDAAPVLRVLLEGVALKGINLVPDETCDGHVVVLRDFHG
jgi:hypothetical protein